MNCSCHPRGLREKCRIGFGGLGKPRQWDSVASRPQAGKGRAGWATKWASVLSESSPSQERAEIVAATLVPGPEGCWGLYQGRPGREGRTWL